MKKRLDPYKTIAIIGLAKNTGKTTTLNTLIRLFEPEHPALTSIGLDGEAIDKITALPKPRITVSKGMIVATASQCLTTASASFDIIEETDFQTALGRVIIVRITASGHMLVAGPTTNNALEKLLKKLRNHTDRIFIDGAFNRMTFANIPIIDGIILTTGASVDSAMEKTLKKTQRIIELFNLNQYPLLTHKPHVKMIIFKNDVSLPFYHKDHKQLIPYLNHLRSSRSALYIQGAHTDNTVRFLMDNELDNLIIIADDPTKYLFSDRMHGYLEKMNIVPYVIHPCPLILVTINPFSPDGRHYDAETWLEKARQTLPIPVYDVMKME